MEFESQKERVVHLKRMLMSQAAVTQLAREAKERLLDEVLSIYRRGGSDREIHVKLGQISAFESILEEFRGAESEYNSLTSNNN